MFILSTLPIFMVQIVFLPLYWLDAQNQMEALILLSAIINSAIVL